jgi:hypothetical protein
MSWFHSILGLDKTEADKAAAADARLRAMNEARAAELGAEWKAQVDRNYETQAVFGYDAQKREVNIAFKEGLDDGAKGITGFISGVFSFVGKALGAVLLGIPAWAWLLVGVGVWFYLGTPGLNRIKQKFNL